MATIRVGVGSFNIQDGAVGFGTDTDGLGNLKVKGVTKTTGSIVSGVSTLTRYSGFAADNINQLENITPTSEVGTIGDIVVGVGTSVIISTASTVTVGTVESVSIGTHFSPPTGGIEERGQDFVEGMMRFNTDLNTMEFYNGNEWRQFTYISDVQNSPSSRGRGVFGGGFNSPASPHTNTTLMHMIEITTLGNSEFFGNLTLGRRNPGGRVSDGTRGLILGGYAEPVGRDTIDYCTIASAGDFIDFGNLTAAKYAIASNGVSSSTRGVVGGGVDPSPASVNVMDYVEIQTIGNALDFGDLTIAYHHGQAVNSPTRGLFCGSGPGLGTKIQSITISSTGNAVDIADLTAGRYYGAGVSNGVRGVIGGGIVTNPGAPGMASSIDFMTIASDGNAIFFGDLTTKRGKLASAETHIRGVFIGSDSGVPSTSTYTNVMDFINIASAGNAQDFGDATNAGNHQLAGFSDSHGGLGGF